MAITTSPDNIPSPTSGDPYNYVVDMAALADGTQDALTQKANMGVGTSTQRVAALSKFPNGALWYDTTTDSDWRKLGGAWEQLGQWTAYTPTITGLTLGNGTATGRYHRIGDTVHLHISIDIGSTTTMGSAAIALPFATLSEVGGVATLIRVGGSRQLGQARVNGSTVIVYAVVPSTGNNVSLDATTPFTWTADSFILVDATYEAA